MLLSGTVVGTLVSCGGGGGGTASGGPATPTVGYAMPSEISPISTGGTGASIVSAGRFVGALKTVSALQAGALASDPGTDYSSASTKRFVSEHSVDQFDIIETILNAVGQTHYADAENLNAGPYKAIVSWQEKDRGIQTKSTMVWTVDSAIIQENGQFVNRLWAWIEDSGQLIKAEFKIYASATKRADGSYQDYGVWTLNVKFDEAGTSFFAARASIGAAGETVLSINEVGGGGGNEIRKAIMHKADTLGYGKVSYPEWQNNTPVQTTAAYAYNPAQLRVHNGTSTVYKDRASQVEIVQRYGMYDSVTGQDVMKSHSFGFPVSYTSAGAQLYAYYGAWQGRHQLWAGQGSTVPDGTTVTRQDRGSATESFKTISFLGTLTKRTLVAATLGDLLNIPAETWINFSHQLLWNGSQWAENGAAFTDFGSLATAPRKSVWISGWNGGQQTNYVYEPSGPSGGGFYAAQNSGNGQFTRTTDTPYAPQLNDQLWVNINGSIYIEYQGPVNGWKQKTVTAFDQQTWTPTFDPAGDQSFTLEANRQYYINKQGGNYVVTDDGAGTCSVKIEIQAAANPVNLASVLSGVATLRPQWYSDGQTSTYRYVTDATDPKFLKLVYATVGTQDPGKNIDDVVTQGQWGLAAFDGQGNNLPTQFNWDYPQNGETGAAQTFLYTDDGLGGRTYKLLDDSIQLQPIVLNGRTLSLQFDGWMHGLPDYYNDLALSDWTITDAIASKIINLPEGTAAINALDPSTSYLLKPLEISLYLKLAAVPDNTLDITAADALDLNDPAVIPVFVDHGMGTTPDIPVVKYSEGVKVQ
jgi:hypothetical protein